MPLLSISMAENNAVKSFSLRFATSPSSIKTLSSSLEMFPFLSISMVCCSSAKGHSEVEEADGTSMKFTVKEFQNQGRTVHTKTEIITFIPRTKVGICNLVKWAKSKPLHVRASGYRHSWSNITVDDNQSQVLVSVLPIRQAEHLPSNANRVIHSGENDLQEIELLDKYVEEDGVRKRLCKIGAATTNERFRRWVIKNLAIRGTKNWCHGGQYLSMLYWLRLLLVEAMRQFAMGLNGRPKH